MKEMYASVGVALEFSVPLPEMVVFVSVAQAGFSSVIIPWLTRPAVKVSYLMFATLLILASFVISETGCPEV